VLVAFEEFERSMMKLFQETKESLLELWKEEQEFKRATEDHIYAKEMEKEQIQNNIKKIEKTVASYVNSLRGTETNEFGNLKENS